MFSCGVVTVYFGLPLLVLVRLSILLCSWRQLGVLCAFARRIGAPVRYARAFPHVRPPALVPRVSHAGCCHPLLYARSAGLRCGPSPLCCWLCGSAAHRLVCPSAVCATAPGLRCELSALCPGPDPGPSVQCGLPPVACGL
eukprot:scaffold4886_cov123-Isochrysis_galbana.AAC.3